MCEETQSLLVELEEQFLQYQSMAETDIPKHIWETAKVSTENSITMNIIWGYLKPLFPLLAEVAPISSCNTP